MLTRRIPCFTGQQSLLSTWPRRHPLKISTRIQIRRQRRGAPAQLPRLHRFLPSLRSLRCEEASLGANAGRPLTFGGRLRGFHGLSLIWGNCSAESRRASMMSSSSLDQSAIMGSYEMQKGDENGLQQRRSFRLAQPMPQTLLHLSSILWRQDRDGPHCSLQ